MSYDKLVFLVHKSKGTKATTIAVLKSAIAGIKYSGGEVFTLKMELLEV